MNCPTCSGPMTPMISSWFCPRDCDRPAAKPASTWVTTLAYPVMLRGQTWLATVVPPGTQVLSIATHGWWISKTDKIDEVALQALVDHESRWGSTFPWKILAYDLDADRVCRDGGTLLAMWLL